MIIHILLQCIEILEILSKVIQQLYFFKCLINGTFHALFYEQLLAMLRLNAFKIDQQ